MSGRKSAKKSKPAARASAKPSASAIKKAVSAQLKDMKSRMPKAGPSVGAQLGDFAQSWLSKITGLGEYKIQGNSLLHGSQVPAMHSAKDGFRIRHREYIGDISSSIAFANSSYEVNPGLDETFPWLSSIAQNFEEYSIEGMIVEFKSTSADALNSTNTALGTIVICAEYNVHQAAYVNKQQMENSLFCVSGKPSESLIMPIECDPKQNPFKIQYVRTGDVPSGQDKRLYDLCNFQVASVGSQAAAVVGELWVSYDIVLRKPQLSSGLGLALDTLHYSLVAPVVTTAYFGTSRSELFDSYGASFSGTVLTLPAGNSGKHQLVYTVSGDSTAVVNPTFTYTNATLDTVYQNNAVTQISNGSTTATRYIVSHVFIITDPALPVTLTMSGGTLPANPTYGDLLVSQVNGNLD